MAKEKRTPEQLANLVFTQHRIDDEPAPGYTTSVTIQNTERGPLIVFVGVGLTPTPLDEEGALYSHTVTTGKNEAGVTSRILKQLNLSGVKQGALRQLKDENESDYQPLDIAIQQLTDGLTTRTQSRTPKFKAELAAAYLGQIRATGSKIGRAHV